MSSQCQAVAEAAAFLGSTVAAIPAGEMWAAGELRPCLEDWIGVGAVIAALPETCSPEAELAAAAFHDFKNDLPRAVFGASSGKELIERGFMQDVELAVELNVSRTVPRLNSNGAFTQLRLGAGSLT